MLCGQAQLWRHWAACRHFFEDGQRCSDLWTRPLSGGTVSSFLFSLCLSCDFHVHCFCLCICLFVFMCIHLLFCPEAMIHIQLCLLLPKGAHNYSGVVVNPNYCMKFFWHKTIGEYLMSLVLKVQPREVNICYSRCCLFSRGWLTFAVFAFSCFKWVKMSSCCFQG